MWIRTPSPRVLLFLAIAAPLGVVSIDYLTKQLDAAIDRRTLLELAKPTPVAPVPRASVRDFEVELVKRRAMELAARATEACRLEEAVRLYDGLLTRFPQHPEAAEARNRQHLLLWRLGSQDLSWAPEQTREALRRLPFPGGEPCSNVRRGR